MEEQEIEVDTKRERIKRHFRANRKTYITGGVCLITGAIGMRVYLARYGVSYQQVIDYRMASIVANIKKARKTNVYQTISIYGNVIGRPGIAVVDKTTGKRFESMTLAADAIGVSVAGLSKHLKGEYPDIAGHVFEKIAA